MNSEVNITAKKNTQLMRYGAISLFTMPLCYVCMFVIFGLVLNIPQSDILNEKIAYIAHNQGVISIAYIIGYLVFGILLLITVQASHIMLTKNKSYTLNTASAFGFIWVVLMMCSGMIALAGMNTMVNIHAQDQQHAEIVYYVYATVVNALGGGIELVGGLWVFLLSIAGLRTQQVTKALCVFGIIVGVLGMLTVYQGLPEFKKAFGLSQIVWFICKRKYNHTYARMIICLIIELSTREIYYDQTNSSPMANHY